MECQLWTTQFTANFKLQNPLFYRKYLDRKITLKLTNFSPYYFIPHLLFAILGLTYLGKLPYDIHGQIIDNNWTYSCTMIRWLESVCCNPTSFHHGFDRFSCDLQDQRHDNPTLVRSLNHAMGWCSYSITNLCWLLPTTERPSWGWLEEDVPQLSI